MRVRRTAVTLAALLAVPAFVPLQPAAAAPAAGTADDVVLQELATDAAEQRAVRAYWTPQRIADVPHEEPSDRPPSDGPDGAAYSGDGTVAATVGRLFYVDHDGADSSCTATVVRSANRSTVVTAGHCVVTHNLLGEDARWAENLMFVPGFRDGAMPYGAFPAALGVVDAQWVASGESSDYDQSFLVLGANEQGERVVDAVGAAHQIAFDPEVGQQVHVFGYPRAAAQQPEHQGRPEFVGLRLAHCWGTSQVVPSYPDDPAPSHLRGVPCDMGGGSSGGPRFAAFDPEAGTGVVVGVNTQGASMDGSGAWCQVGSATDCVRYLVGPPLTEVITGPLYERAQNL